MMDGIDIFFKPLGMFEPIFDAIGGVVDKLE